MKSSHNRSLKYILVVISIVVAGSITAYLTRTSDPFQGGAVANPPFTPITYGIQAFLWWDEGIAGLQLDWTEKLLGFSHIKHTFAWRNMEPRRGEWDFSQADRIVDEVNKRGLKLIVRLGQVPAWAADGIVVEGNSESHDVPPVDMEAWANYCRMIAERYQGQVAAYQIWNEPNLSREWGNQEPDALAYVELLRLCSEAIREVDSAAILISAGLSPTGDHNQRAHRDDIFLDAMYNADFQQYVDVVGVHAPGYAPPAYGPDEAERDGRGRWATFRRVEDLRKIMLRHGDAARQMAILEFGWTTDSVNSDYAWFAVSEEMQAQYIVEAYQYASEHWRPWVGLMSLIYLHDPNWTRNDEEWWWAITTSPVDLRPAFFSIVSMDRYCGDTIVNGWPPGTPEEVYLEQRITCP